MTIDQKHVKLRDFIVFEGIESRPFLPTAAQAWLDRWNARAKREAARRWAKKHPGPVARKLRKALNQRIRAGSPDLRNYLRGCAAVRALLRGRAAFRARRKLLVVSLWAVMRELNNRLPGVEWVKP